MGPKSMACRFVAVVGSLGLLVPLPAASAQEPATQPPTQDEVRSPIEQLNVFADLIGVWNVVERHLDDQGREVAAAKGTEEILWELDQRVLRRIYTTSTDWRSYRAIGFLTWNKAAARYEGAWFDNNTTNGPTLVTAVWDAAQKLMTYTLRTMADDGTAVTLRVEDRMLSDEHRRATTYLIQGEKSTKRLEVDYKRPPPCPAANSVGIIQGE